MKRLLIGVFLTFCFFTSFTKGAKASFVTMQKSGGVLINVLASETVALKVPTPSSLEVTSAASETNPQNLITLAKEAGKVNLSIGGEKKFDVTSWKDELVQIEERENVKKISIFLKDGNFIISQEGASAETQFPIKIDPVQDRLTVATHSGEKYLAILPTDAVESVLRAKLVSKIDNKNFPISEENKDLAYTVSGEKRINIFNVYNLDVPLEAKVSASTGEIISTNEPVWLKLVSFLMS
jgi:hypothetical protein